MSDGPVGVVRDRVHRLDGHERPFEGRHAVEGDGRHQELQDVVLAHLVPGPAQRQETVDHASPGRHPEHDGEHHAQGLRPARKSRVVEVVRSRPDVHEDQRPEVDDGQPVGVDGPVHRLGDEVVHHAQEGGGEDEGHRVVAVPPLHQGVLGPREHRVALEERDGDEERLHDVQGRHRDDGGGVEPDRDVDVLLAAAEQGPEVVDGEHHPDDRDGELDGPFQFAVFLAEGQPLGECERGADDDGLPPPEVDLGEDVRVEPRLHQPLGAVVGRREERVAGEPEDHAVGVQGPDAPEGDVGNPHVDPPVGEFGGDEDPDEHADESPDDRRPEELTHDLVVVGQSFETGVLFWLGH